MSVCKALGWCTAWRLAYARGSEGFAVTTVKTEESE